MKTGLQKILKEYYKQRIEFHAQEHRKKNPSSMKATKEYQRTGMESIMFNTAN